MQKWLYALAFVAMLAAVPHDRAQAQPAQGLSLIHI